MNGARLNFEKNEAKIEVMSKQKRHKYDGEVGSDKVWVQRLQPFNILSRYDSNILP